MEQVLLNCHDIAKVSGPSAGRTAWESSRVLTAEWTQWNPAAARARLTKIRSTP